MTPTQDSMLNTTLPCTTPDTIVFSSSLCFSTLSSNCHVDNDDYVDYSGSGSVIVSTIRPAVLQFDDNDDNN